MSIGIHVAQSYDSSMVLHSLHMISISFLGAHFVWAFNLVFLFNSCSYWQELIESIIWSRNKLKVIITTNTKFLKIVQSYM